MITISRWLLASLVLMYCSVGWVVAQPHTEPGTSAKWPPPLTHQIIEGPAIDIWYGPQQVFGAIGSPIPFVNILGRVSSPVGVSALFYSLNGSIELPLSIGPDGLRLADAGDFNVEIEITDLLDGINIVVIRALDTLNHESTTEVEVRYSKDTSWPQRYRIEWPRVESIQDVAQVLDGRWELSPEGLRPLQTDYDRLVAIGDRSWRDYEVTIPITIESIDPRAFEASNGGAAVGIILRWPGHVDWGDEQPRIGWFPHGAIGLFRWTGTLQNQRTSIQIFGNQEFPFVLADQPREIVLGTTYLYKMRAETRIGEGGSFAGSRYRLKIWERDQPEPRGWDLTVTEGDDDPQFGSLVLLSHYVNCVFGDVRVEPLN